MIEADPKFGKGSERPALSKGDERTAREALLTKAIEFVALNDDVGSEDALKVSAVRSYMTVHLIAATFGVSGETIARRVVKVRKDEEAKLERSEGREP